MARFPQARIDALVGAAHQYAASQPGMLGLLARTSVDASVERLRRGVLAIAASIMDRVRDFDADSYSALADVVAPSLGRPFPAASIVELLAHEGPSRRIAAGAEVSSARAPWCRFRLAGYADVGPYTVQNVRARGISLQFDMTATANVPLEVALGEELRLFVEGPREDALQLLTHVLHHTERVELSTSETAGQRLGAAVHPYGMRAEDMLAPEPDGPPTATAFLQEYFVFPEKFLFFAVPGVASALRGTNARHATVTLRFARPLPARMSVPRDILRAHCVPAVNLFSATSEPQTFGPGKTTFPVRVAGMSRAHGGVYSVVSAVATPRHRPGFEIALPAVRRFAAEKFSRDFPYAYSTQRVSMHAEQDPELFVTLTNPRGAEPLLDPHVISLRLLATNRACDLGPGELTVPGSGMPATLRVRNIVPTSKYVPAAAGAEFALRAFMRGAIPHQDALASLQTLLFSLLPPEEVEPARFRANVARVRALEKLDICPTTDTDGSRRGYRASMMFDESEFRGAGDVALFVRLLHRLLDGHVTTNAFYRCEATLKKSGDKVQWPPAEAAPSPHVHPCRARTPDAPHTNGDALRHTRRRTPNATMERFVQTASHYGFFSAARLLEHLFAVDMGSNHGTQQPIRFGQVPSLSFPSGDVASLTISEPAHPRARLALRFLGLIGTASPMGAPWTEELLQRDDEGSLRDFYDVLHHPLAVRLYQAWKTRAIEGGFDLEGHDPLSRILRSLAGVDAATVLPKEPLPPMVALGLADFQRGQPHGIDVRSAEQLLQRLLPWPISLEPNIHRAVSLDATETAHLGAQCSSLGDDFVYGEERDDSEGLVRLHLGPVDRATYEKLMPGGSVYAELYALTTRIFDGKVAIELEVHLDADDAPAWELGASDLGVETYYSMNAGESLHVRVLLLADPERAVREFVTAIAT